MTVEPDVRVGQESDASVVERSWQEPEVFAVLFDRHADSVHGYAARRLGAEAAEDVMAETFTTAFQQRFRYDTGRPAPVRGCSASRPTSSAATGVPRPGG